MNGCFVAERFKCLTSLENFEYHTFLKNLREKRKGNVGTIGERN